MAVIDIVFMQFGLGLLMIIWRYGVFETFVKTICRGIYKTVVCIIWMVWKLLLWLLWFVAFCGCCNRCSLKSAFDTATKCVDTFQERLSSILKNSCWHIHCEFKLPTKIFEKVTSCKARVQRILRRVQRSPLFLAVQPQWYWLHLSAQVGFLYREFRVISILDGWYWECVFAYFCIGLVVFFTAQQVWKFSKVRNLTPDSRKAIDQVLDMLLLPINYGFLCALCVRSLKMDKSNDHEITAIAIAIVDSADVWESWALWSVLQLFIRVVDTSASRQVGGRDQPNNSRSELAAEGVAAVEPSPEPATEVPSARVSETQVSIDADPWLGAQGVSDIRVPSTKLVQKQGNSTDLAIDSDIEGAERADQDPQVNVRGHGTAFERGQSFSASLTDYGLNLGTKYLDVVASFKYLSNYGVQSWVYLLIGSSLVELAIKGVVTPRFPTACYTLFSSCTKNCDEMYDQEISPSVYVVEYILCCAAIVFVLVFERTFKEYLHDIEPYWKFWGVKCVVSVTFAQKIAINHCCGFEEWQVYLYHCLLICLELPILCAVHTYLSYPYNRDWMFLLIRSDEVGKSPVSQTEDQHQQSAEAKSNRLQSSSTASLREDGLAAASITEGRGRKGRGRSPQRKAGTKVLHSERKHRAEASSPAHSSSSQTSIASFQSSPPPHLQQPPAPMLRRNHTAGPSQGRDQKPPDLERSVTTGASASGMPRPLRRSPVEQGVAPTSLAPAGSPESPQEPPDVSGIMSPKFPRKEHGTERQDPLPENQESSDHIEEGGRIGSLGCCRDDEDDSGLGEEEVAKKAADRAESPWVYYVYLALGCTWCFVGIRIVQHILPYNEGAHGETSDKRAMMTGTCPITPQDYINTLTNASVRLPHTYDDAKMSMCTTMALECAQGFTAHRDESPTLACTADEKHHGYKVNGRCDSTRCGSPIHIENAHPEDRGEECCDPGSEVSYACIDGFEGSAKATCNSEGHWQIKMNNCQIVGCGSLETAVRRYLDANQIYRLGKLPEASFDGQVVDFKCSYGLRGNPQAICYNQTWHLTDASDGTTNALDRAEGEPCGAFVTTHGCECRDKWTHCSGFFFTDCYEYYGCVDTPDRDFSWCRVDASTSSSSCRSLLREKNWYGQVQDWDYCVKDNFGISWPRQRQRGRNWREAARVLTPQFLFCLAAFVTFFLTFYVPSTFFWAVVYCIPRVPGWKKLCYTCCTRPPRATRRIWLVMCHKLRVDITRGKEYLEERWATFVTWRETQVEGWSLWVEAQVGTSQVQGEDREEGRERTPTPSTHSDTSESDDLHTVSSFSRLRWVANQLRFGSPRFGFLKESRAKEKRSTAGNLANATETPTNSKLLTDPLLEVDDHL